MNLKTDLSEVSENNTSNNHELSGDEIVTFEKKTFKLLQKLHFQSNFIRLVLG